MSRKTYPSFSKINRWTASSYVTSITFCPLGSRTVLPSADTRGTVIPGNFKIHPVSVLFFSTSCRGAAQTCFKTMKEVELSMGESELVGSLLLWGYLPCPPLHLSRTISGPFPMARRKGSPHDEESLKRGGARLLGPAHRRPREGPRCVRWPAP